MPLPMNQICRICSAEAKGLYCQRCLRTATLEQLKQHFAFLKHKAVAKKAPVYEPISASYGKPKFVRERPKKRERPELTGHLKELYVLLGAFMAQGQLDGLEGKALEDRLFSLRGKLDPEPKAAEPEPIYNKCRCCGAISNERVCQRCLREEAPARVV